MRGLMHLRGFVEQNSKQNKIIIEKKAENILSNKKKEDDEIRKQIKIL